MNLQYTHKPNYFLYAQLLVRHVEQYIQKHADAENAIFDLRDIYDLFRHDLASSTTNLDSILNIADEYRVDTLNGAQKVIAGYKIDVENNSLLIDFNSEALQALRNGQPLIAPDATLTQ